MSVFWWKKSFPRPLFFKYSIKVTDCWALPCAGALAEPQKPLLKSWGLPPNESSCLPSSVADWKGVMCWNRADLGSRAFPPPRSFTLLVLSFLFSRDDTCLVELPCIKTDTGWLSVFPGYWVWLISTSPQHISLSRSSTMFFCLTGIPRDSYG